MEKPSKLRNYDEKEGLNEHIQLVDDQLSCFSTDDASKCKLFALTMVVPARLWFIVMPDDVIFLDGVPQIFYAQSTA